MCDPINTMPDYQKITPKDRITLCMIIRILQGQDVRTLCMIIILACCTQGQDNV